MQNSPNHQANKERYQIPVGPYTMSSPRSHSTITVPPEIQRAAAGILITDPPTAAYTHLEDIQSDKYLGVLFLTIGFHSINTQMKYLKQKATNLLHLCRRNLHMCQETSKKQHTRPSSDPTWNMLPYHGTPTLRGT